MIHRSIEIRLMRPRKPRASGDDPALADPLGGDPA